MIFRGLRRSSKHLVNYHSTCQAPSAYFTALTPSNRDVIAKDNNLDLQAVYRRDLLGCKVEVKNIPSVVLLIKVVPAVPPMRTIVGRICETLGRQRWNQTLQHEEASTYVRCVC
jgi:hypothetical protein